MDPNRTPPAYDPQEPIFVLRGSDPTAHILMMMWACLQERLGAFGQSQFNLAVMHAIAMEIWARSHGQDVQSPMLACTAMLTEAARWIGSAATQERSQGTVH